MTLLELLQLMRKHLKLMIVLPIVCALATAVVCFVALPNTYTASTSMYVLAKQSSANSDNAANYSNLNASQMMANDVSTLLKSDRIEADTAKDLHLESLKGYSTKVTSETTSRVITLSVTGTDPDIAATIANDMASNVSKVAQQVMDVQSVNVIDQATAPTAPPPAPIVPCTSPSRCSPACSSPSPSSWCPICSTRRCATPTRSKTCWACPSSAACLLSREVNKLWLANLKAATIWRCRTPRRP